MAAKKGERRLKSFGEVTFNAGLSCAILSDFNNYILIIKRTDEENKESSGREMFFSKLSDLFEKLYDILVKEHAGTAGLNAFENVRKATEAARADILMAIEKITGDSKMARIAGSLE